MLRHGQGLGSMSEFLSKVYLKIARAFVLYAVVNFPPGFDFARLIPCIFFLQWCVVPSPCLPCLFCMNQQWCVCRGEPPSARVGSARPAPFRSARSRTSTEVETDSQKNASGSRNSRRKKAAADFESATPVFRQCCEKYPCSVIGHNIARKAFLVQLVVQPQFHLQ